jgi:heme/copper-type cytochrome/quinol oxidase subunit 3
MWSWAREVVIEAYHKGLHTLQVQNGLMYGMALFLLSEAMLFFPFFWAFFHTSLSPSYAIGMVWPPVGIEVLNPSMLPLVNTIVLLTSGVSLVSAHRAIVGGNYGVVINGLYITIMLGIFFS